MQHPALSKKNIQKDAPESQKNILLLCGILLLGLLLRLYNLGAFDYWQDEIFNLIKAEHLYEVLFSGNIVSNHPPLYAILVTLWCKLGLDASEGLMRTLPMLLGLLGIFAAYVAGKAFYNAKAGLLCAFLLAISPFHIHHSQELKVYILGPLAGTLAVYTLYRAVQQNTWKHWLLYALAAATACYSELFLGPVLVGINLWFLLHCKVYKGRLLRWFVGNLIGAALFLPYLPIMVLKSKAIMIDLSNWWVPRPNLVSIAFYFKTLAFGYSDTAPLFHIATALFGLLFCIGIYYAFRHNRRNALLLLCWSLLPLLQVFIISQFTQSIFLVRSMIPYAIPCYLLVAIGITSLPIPRLRLSLIAIFTALILLPLVQQYHGEYPLTEFPHRPGVHPPLRYRAAADYINTHWQEGDILIHASGDPSFLPLYYYGLRGKPQFRADVNNEFIHIFNTGNPVTTRLDDFKTYWVQQLQPLVRDKNRVWMIYAEWERLYLPGFPTGVWRWMENHFTEIRHENFARFEVFLYAKEHNNQPIRTLLRDQDNGVSAVETRSFAPQSPYTHIQADSNLVPTPVEQRKGNLVLQFTSSSTASPTPLGPATDTRDISFAVQNTSASPIDTTIECLPSMALLPLTTLYEDTPDSDMWRVARTYNPDAPPQSYEIAMLEGHLTPPAASASYSFTLPPGHYCPLLRCLNFGHVQQYCSLQLNETPLLPSHQRPRQYPHQWHWISLPPVDLQADADNAHVTITGLPKDTDHDTWVNLSHIALSPCREDSPAIGTPLSPWPGKIHLPPHQTQHFTARISTQYKRIDIWCYEYVPNGKAYYIFKQLPTSP